MAEKIAPEALHGRWIHAHEEDTPTEMVFRPASHPLPPSRGRQGFELRADGSCVETGIGPTDKLQMAQCSWSLRDDNELTIHPGGGRGQGRVLRVASASPDRLVIRK